MGKSLRCACKIQSPKRKKFFVCLLLMIILLIVFCQHGKYKEIISYHHLGNDSESFFFPPFWVSYFFGENRNILINFQSKIFLNMTLKKEFKWKLVFKCIKFYFLGWQLLVTLTHVLYLKVSILYVHLGFYNNRYTHSNIKIIYQELIRILSWIYLS